MANPNHADDGKFSSGQGGAVSGAAKLIGSGKKPSHGTLGAGFAGPAKSANALTAEAQAASQATKGHGAGKGHELTAMKAHQAAAKAHAKAGNQGLADAHTKQAKVHAERAGVPLVGSSPQVIASGKDLNPAKPKMGLHEGAGTAEGSIAENKAAQDTLHAGKLSERADKTGFPEHHGHAAAANLAAAESSKIAGDEVMAKQHLKFAAEHKAKAQQGAQVVGGGPKPPTQKLADQGMFSKDADQSKSPAGWSGKPAGAVSKVKSKAFSHPDEPGKLKMMPAETQRAVEQSNRAFDLKTESAHRDAGIMHERASEMASQNGNHPLADAHNKAADEHIMLADKMESEKVYQDAAKAGNSSILSGHPEVEKYKVRQSVRSKMSDHDR